MNAEFHYFSIYYLAKQAGLDNQFAEILAASSQYVDASTYPIAFSSSDSLINIAVTQNYVFWDETVSRNIYQPFHFLPGGSTGGMMPQPAGTGNPYKVQPNGEIAKGLLIMAFQEREAFLMGIALHSYADTWAHQNFSGFLEEGNNIAFENSVVKLPPAGHLQALTLPDEPDRVWVDPRMPESQRTIHNADRFLQAARKIYRYLCVYNHKSFDDEDLILDPMREMWTTRTKAERFLDYTIDWDIAPWDSKNWLLEAGASKNKSMFAEIRNYDKFAWARSELLKALGDSPPPFEVDSSFYSSQLYHWHEAATEHRKRALSALSKRGL